MCEFSRTPPAHAVEQTMKLWCVIQRWDVGMPEALGGSPCPFFCLIAEVCSWIPAGKLSHSLMFLQDPWVSWCPGHSLRTSNMVKGGRMCSSQSAFTDWGSQLTSVTTEGPHGPWQDGGPLESDCLPNSGFPVGSHGGSEVKNLPAMQETWAQSLGAEHPLEKGVATHSSILAWKMDRGGWWATVHGVAKSWTQLRE